MGTGSGALAIEAARRGTRVTAVDVSWRAVCDGTAERPAGPAPGPHPARQPLRPGARAVVRPHPGQSAVCAHARHGPRAARCGPVLGRGRDGRLVLDRICREAPALLRPGRCPPGRALGAQLSRTDAGASARIRVEGIRDAASRDPVRARAAVAGGLAAGARSDGSTGPEGRAGGRSCRTPRLTNRAGSRSSDQGPLLVEGPVEVELEDGTIVVSDRFRVACAPAVAAVAIRGATPAIATGPRTGPRTNDAEAIRGVGQAAPLRPADPRCEIARGPSARLALPIREPLPNCTGTTRSRS